MTLLESKITMLETDRLILRKHVLDDLQACCAMWSDPAVTRYIMGGRPSSPQQTWARMLNYAGHWSFMRFGYWAVEEKETRNFVGELGFADFKRDIAASMKGSPELGWAFVSAAHGRGFATEAVRAATAWGDEHLAAPKTVALIDPQNLASIRVAEKCGYALFERSTYNGEPMLFYSRQRTAPGVIPVTPSERAPT